MGQWDTGPAGSHQFRHPPTWRGLHQPDPEPAPEGFALRQWIKRHLPSSLVGLIVGTRVLLRRSFILATHKVLGLAGLNIVRRGDYYSTLPRLDELARNKDRWNKPSALAGIRYDPESMRSLLFELHSRWNDDFERTAGEYAANQQRGFGPGYPKFDARILYYLLREWKPRRYLEIGSGLSTFYASLAAGKNAENGSTLRMTCVEPFPYGALRTIPNIEIRQDFAQNVPLTEFETLEAGDVLFIDSSHALKIDSDVSWLLLEVLPRLKSGVYVHIHDIPFPYNVPFPASKWIFGDRWPVYWNEAMAVQAFLAFNSAYEIVLSAPMLRHLDESGLQSRFSDYVPLDREEDPFSALWIRRIS
jgi:predicted O-methyltransferase YrrM